MNLEICKECKNLRICSHCKGTGKSKVDGNKCEYCNGTGVCHACRMQNPLFNFQIKTKKWNMTIKKKIHIAAVDVRQTAKELKSIAQKSYKNAKNTPNYAKRKKHAKINQTTHTPQSEYITTTESVRICETCGVSLPENAEFCQNCGSLQ